MGEQTKRCTKCQRDLPVVTYYRRRTDRGMRYNSWCRSCLADNSREYQRSERGRSKYLLKTYGLTADQLAAMFEAQEHRCAICRRAIDETNRHIDHDHTSGAVRGLLCGNCNKGLGLFRDDPHALTAAAGYLSRIQEDASHGRWQSRHAEGQG